MGEDIASLAKLLWARILVKCKGRDTPKIVEVRAGSKSLLLQLWREFPPELGFIRAESKTVKQKGKGPNEDSECFPHARANVIFRKKTLLQTDGKAERDATNEALIRPTTQFTRGYLGHRLGSNGSSSKSPEPLEEPYLNKGGLVGVGPPVEADRNGPLPFSPPMLPHFGTPSFDGPIIWADGKPNSLGPRPEKLLKPVETGGPETGLGLGFSGLRPESLADLSCDQVDVEDFNPPLLAASSGARASTPNAPDEDAMERRYVDAVDSELNSVGKRDGLFFTITRYEA